MNVAVQTLENVNYFISPQVVATMPPLKQKVNYRNQHSILVLFVVLGVMWVFSHIILEYFQGIGVKDRVLFGIVGSILLFLIFSVLQLPDGIMQRPSREFWRFCLGLSILHLCFLIFLLFQDYNDIMKALIAIDPSLSIGTNQLNYADGNCNIFDSKYGVFSKMDFFVICHFFGWFTKTLIVRDSFLLWFNSIFFEWLEITFRHILPNFHECWWDHLILDIFGCNFLGIIFGGIFIKHLRMCEYDWYNLSNYNNLSFTKSTRNSKISEEKNNIFIYLWYKFGIYSWTEYKWPRIFSSVKSFSIFILSSLIVQLIDLNYFFLKSEFLLPVTHWTLGLRTILVAICGTAATRELYEYSIGNTLDKVGIQCWVLIAIIISETILCWRNIHVLKVYPLLPSTSVCYIWIFIFIFIVSVYIYLFFIAVTNMSSKKENKNNKLS